MFSIVRATENDFKTIAHIGNISVEEAHRESCSAKDMKSFLDETYSDSAIKKELQNTKNLYHILNYKGCAVGFSKILLNSEHSNISQKNITKLDRIYLLPQFYNLKLGFELLKFNIEYSKREKQSGMWLFTWIGNTRAVDFYLKTGFRVVGSHQFKVTETHYNQHHQMFKEFYET